MRVFHTSVKLFKALAQKDRQFKFISQHWTTYRTVLPSHLSLTCPGRRFKVHTDGERERERERVLYWLKKTSVEIPIISSTFNTILDVSCYWRTIMNRRFKALSTLPTRTDSHLPGCSLLQSTDFRINCLYSLFARQLTGVKQRMAC